MKKIYNLIIVAMAVLVLTGCSFKKSFTYKVETGDNVKVELDVSDGYDLTSELPFTISKNGDEISKGSFITLEGYDQYESMIKMDSDAKIIDKGEDKNVTYIFYSYKDTEYNYIIKINDSKTAVALGNQHSEEEAKKCFELLTFSLEK